MKILEICAKLNIGGAQAVAANIARYAEQSFEFVYIVFGYDIGEYEKDIISRGHRIIHIPSPDEGRLKYFRFLLKLMNQENFDIIHCHTMYSCGIAMLAAKIARVPGRISHSHTAQDAGEKGFMRKIYIEVMRIMIRRCGTDFCACGIEAGKRLFGSRFFTAKGTIIKNGIDIASYGYNSENNLKIRLKYDILDKFVIGHVGHYVKEKNQQFLIQIMPKILRAKPNAVLLMFGEGNDRAYLNSMISKMKLENYVYLMGNVSNINEVLSAFDVFVFPSLFEGTPLSLIEAQANGLPCIISSDIPKDACLTDLVEQLPLNNEETWVNSITNKCRQHPETAVYNISKVYESVQTSMNSLYEIFLKYRN